MGVVEITDEFELRKFHQLKLAVMHLGLERKFDKYCYYGCYCLTNGAHKISSAGYGKPLDKIDQSCFEFKQCYRCLKDAHSEKRPCVGEDVSYSMDLITDEISGEKSIECTNMINSCRYNVCQCDKKGFKAILLLGTKLI